MRIIAGKHGSRKIFAPPGRETRPTSDRAKESLFSSLRELVVDAEVLDLFSGTGSLGWEALSRGAKKVVFVEKSWKAMEVLKKNCSLLGEEENCVILKTSVETLPGKYEHIFSTCSFDLVFLDPPYPLYQTEKFFSWILKPLSRLPIKPEGRIIFEHPPRVILPWKTSLVKQLKCGDNLWSIFQKNVGTDFSGPEEEPRGEENLEKEKEAAEPKEEGEGE